MNAILGIFVSEEAKLMPVGCLPDSRYVLVGKEAEIDIFSREFELVHQNAWIALVNSNLLVSMDSNKSEADLFNIDIVDSGMGKDIVCVQVN